MSKITSKLNKIKYIAVDIAFKDDSQRGINDGKADAEAGKNKDTRRAGGKFPIPSGKFMLQGNRAYDSYVDGYNAAYDLTMQAKIVSDISQTKPIKTKTININDNLKNSNNMPRNNYFTQERQIDLLNQLKTSLKKTEEVLYGTAGKYKKTYESLGNTMLRDTVEDFKENYERTMKNIGTLVKQIEEIDIPFIENEIGWWESR